MTRAGNFFCCRACARARASPSRWTAATWSMMAPFASSGAPAGAEFFGGDAGFGGATAGFPLAALLWRASGAAGFVGALGFFTGCKLFPARFRLAEGYKFQIGIFS